MDITLEDLGDDRLGDLLQTIVTSMGGPGHPTAVERWRQMSELELRVGAVDDDQGGAVVGTLGGYSFELSLPGGGSVRTQGLTLVAVRPTHRRRGLLRRMIERAFEAAAQRGQPVGALFASEASIYGRFGYGHAAPSAAIHVDKHRFSLRAEPSREGRSFRLVSHDEALRLLPPVYEGVRRLRAGMPTRSPGWWRVRRIDEAEWRREGRGLWQHVVCERAGAPVGYAIYRHGSGFEHGLSTAELEVVEALAPEVDDLLALYRYLFEIDLQTVVHAELLPLDHPLFHRTVDPGVLRAELSPGLFVRVLDVVGAFERRPLASGPSVDVCVDDALVPGNTGVYRFGGGEVTRLRDGAFWDLELDVEALGSLYLGGFSARELLAAGRARQRGQEAAERFDALLGRQLSPWTPEIF